jgi:hypothetical protein
MTQTIKAIDINQLADILTNSTIENTIDDGGMLAHEISHPSIGKATTVQVDSKALLILGFAEVRQVV